MSDETIVSIFWIGFTFIIMSPLIYWSVRDWYAKRYIKRFCRLHPDWANIHNALIRSANEGKCLYDKQVSVKTEIDTLIQERVYMPHAISHEMTEHIESLKQKYWDITDQLSKHNTEHEKLRLCYKKLSEKYHYKE